MNLNFNEICRLCLRFCEEYVDLNQTNGVKTLADDVVEKIKYCYVVEIDLSEDFPTKICYECIRVLSFFYTTKKNVVISEQLLRDILFMRKKIERDTRSQEEENVTSPDIIEVIQDELKITSVVVEQKNSKPKKLDENNVQEVDLQINCGEKCLTTSETTATVVVEQKDSTPKKLIESNMKEADIQINRSEKCLTTSETTAKPVIGIEIENCDRNGAVTAVSEKQNSKVKKKKKIERLRHSLSSSSSTKNNEDFLLSDVLSTQNSNLEPLIKLRDLRKEIRVSGGSSKTVKDNAVLGTGLPSKENVVKEIGTVIDINNILSPNAKRTRKSVLAS